MSECKSSVQLKMELLQQLPVNTGENMQENCLEKSENNKLVEEGKNIPLSRTRHMGHEQSLAALASYPLYNRRSKQWMEISDAVT